MVQLWRTSSQCMPRYNPVVDDISIIWLERCQKELRKRIDRRVDMMLEAGWVEEVLGLPDEWKQFVRRKSCAGTILLQMQKQLN